MHLFQQHAPQDIDAALAALPILDLGPYLKGEAGALERRTEEDHPVKYEPTLYADLIREFYNANYFHQEEYGKAEIRNRYD